ncbi:hypothetical protein MF4642_11670 [Acinetobacter sp. MF4642]|uniref:hypothetical protein n=1 Tax=Acinetobacter sp. MF4642 TaxID=1960825 RepID=UPI000995B476|nr:hypothetical protein [Acinetobacter sp. MF4642]OOW08984.1 hypothetical protein MF4642_11670 [Acinetobacter sp. MF4642]
MKLKILLILLCTAFTSPVFAGAAERQESIYDAAMKSRNGIGVSNVRAANDMINADITQRVTVDGSNATINTKVSIPANDDSFKRNTAKHAKNLLKGGAVAVGAAIAMDQILDGVGWVIDEGGKVTKKPVETDVGSHHQFFWSYDLTTKFVTPTEALNATCKKYQGSGFAGISNVVISGDIARATCNNSDGSSVGSGVQRNSNPSYDPSAPQPGNVPVPDGEMEDAFYNWFKNNTHSITDPVTTYIYSPKDSKGNALPKSPEGSDPSFGPNEITDEMMDNYMEHRDANLQNPYTTSIQDSTQTDTTQNPDGSKTTTTTNPDGSKTTTRTDTKTDPDTGEVTTTVTETTTMPDGSTSTKTETSTQTKPNPETTELPAFCEYAATLCTWMNRDTEHKADEKSLWEKITEWFDWTKEEPDHKDEDTKVDVSEMDIPDVKTNLFNASGQCPPDFSYPFPLPTGGTYNITYSYLGVCEWFGKLYYINVTCGWIAAYMIVVGRGEKKNG